MLDVYGKDPVKRDKLIMLEGKGKLLKGLGVNTHPSRVVGLGKSTDSLLVVSREKVVLMTQDFVYRKKKGFSHM